MEAELQKDMLDDLDLLKLAPSPHPFVESTKTEVCFLECSIANLKKTKGYRPPHLPRSYTSVVEFISQFLRSFSSRETLASMIALVKVDPEKGIPICQQWLETHHRFCNKLLEDFWFWDVSIPCIVLSTQVRSVIL